MRRPLLFVQNDTNEDAGILKELSAARNIGHHRIFGFDADYRELQANDFCGLVILGGAQSAYETGTYPYLTSQMDLCRSFISANKPIAGFCLGAQILACALGGSVHSGKRKEIGWYDLELTETGEDDALLRGYPKRSMAYHFHGDFIHPAASCKVLARSELTDCQLFRFGSNAYGFQYHAEVDEHLVNSMCRNNTEYLSKNGFDAEKIIDDSRTHFSAFLQRSRSVVDRWLDLLPAVAL